jgi:hypothetical protein
MKFLTTTVAFQSNQKHKFNANIFSLSPFYFFSHAIRPQKMQVTATDGDKDRPQNIVYFLTGQGIDPDNPANSKFDINRTTGEIFVLKVSCWREEKENFYFGPTTNLTLVPTVNFSP